MRKILILAANPKGTPQLRLDEEMREIDEGLKRSQHRDQFELVQKVAVRPRDIQRAMLDVKPQIVHFSGLGAGEEGLIFEDEIGQPKFVTGEALAGLFELFSDQMECVVLNGCYSEVQAEAIGQHIPYVMGMKQAIGDQAAIAFAVGFYDALGAGRPVEFAYKFGCNAIRLEGIAENLTPVLIKKEAEVEAISSPSTSPQPAQSEPPVDLENQAIEVFFSYAHEDEKLRDKLAKQLKILERQGVITAWYDRDISAGTEWANQIDQHLETSKVILLLISDDFVASDYCYDTEMMRAMERHSKREACVIPVILRKVDNWQSAPFGKLQALPRDAKPVTSWDNLDEAFADVARGIRRVVEQLKVEGPRGETRGAKPVNRQQGIIPEKVIPLQVSHSSPKEISRKQLSEEYTLVQAKQEAAYKAYLETAETDPVRSLEYKRQSEALLQNLLAIDKELKNLDQ